MEFSTLSNPYNKNSSIFQQMEEFFLAYTQIIFGFWVWAGISFCLYPIHFWFLGMGEHFLIAIPKSFLVFGYGRGFLFAYTQFIFSFWVCAGISFCYTQSIFSFWVWAGISFCYTQSIP